MGIGEVIRRSYDSDLYGKEAHTDEFVVRETLRKGPKEEEGERHN